MTIREGGRIEVVERFGNAQISIGVVILREFFALMTEIRFDLEFGRKGKFEAIAQAATESFGHLFIGKIGDVTNHPRNAETAPRFGAVGFEIAAIKIRIGEDRLARNLVE